MSQNKTKDGMVGYKDIIERYSSHQDMEYDGIASTKSSNKDQTNRKVKYNVRIFDISEPSDKMDFESIMTDIYSQDSNELLLEEDSYWDQKSGKYMVALKWITIV